jgi:MFS family permease
MTTILRRTPEAAARDVVAGLGTRADRSTPRHAGGPRWSPRTSFWLVVATQVLLFAGSNLPTPLFPIYEQRYRFDSGVVTLLFAVYVAAVLPVLVCVGPMADRVGRRPLLTAGIAITAISSAAFVVANGLPWLFAGEIVYGVGSALVMSCVAVAIRELHPRHNATAGALAASVAAAVGLTLGPLVSGLLAWLTPWPTTTPFAVDIVAAAILAGALCRIPETRPATTTPSSTMAIIHVPAELRTAFFAAAIPGAASFMLVGWVFALSPSYLHDQLGVPTSQPVVAGLFAALVMLTNGAAQVLLRRHHHIGAVRTGLIGIVVGTAVIAGSALVDSVAVAIAGAVIAGIASGIAQMNAMASIQRLAPPEARGRVLSSYFVLCYLALSLPVVLAGEAADRFGLVTATAGYLLALTVVAVWALNRARLGPTPPGFAASPADDDKYEITTTTQP